MIKTKKDIELIRAGGRRLAFVMAEVIKRALPGVLPSELDKLANELIVKNGDVPSFLNYSPRKSERAFPASICVSVNDSVVHGVPTDEPLKEGDVVGIDIGLNHKGRFTDLAVTVPIGKISEEAEKLVKITKEALLKGIKSARVGNTVGDIGFSIEEFVKPHKYGIIRDLAGHGVGLAVHEAPFIPNFGKAGQGEKLLSGMVIAIEPMLTLGGEKLTVGSDGMTYKTKDGSLSAHFEHTILISENGPEVLTKI
ncbi:MAG: type I methionyl aminopeptidase [bacterium]|nr:type I methionyl aminopeptidase [bacterium]